MTPLTFDQLPTLSADLTPPRLPFFDHSNRQVFRCGSVLHTRYSDHRAWCERCAPQQAEYEAAIRDLHERVRPIVEAWRLEHDMSSYEVELVLGDIARSLAKGSRA